MLEAERHLRIEQLVRAHGATGIHLLCRELAASEATIRRDLAKLDQQGRIRRVRGGAQPLPERGYEPYHDAPARSVKRRLARTAAALVADEDTVAIDAGSTTFQMGDQLANRRVTVLTNSFPLANRLIAGERCRVILVPGEIDRDRGAVLDPFDGSYASNFSCTTFFMSAQSLDERGIYNDDSLVIGAEQQLMRIAKRLVLLVDSRKFRRQGNLRLCGWDQIDTVITDDGIAEGERRILAESGVKVVVV